jgi:hypothetical protein
MNEYVVPALVVLAAAALLGWRWKSLARPERNLVIAAMGIILALMLWIPTVSVVAFLRYSIIATPLGCLLAAWMVVRAFGSRMARLAWPCAALLIVAPWASLPLHALVPPPYKQYALNPGTGLSFRPCAPESSATNRIPIGW